MNKMKKNIMVKFYVITVISAFMLVSCGQKEKKNEDIKMEVDGQACCKTHNIQISNHPLTRNKNHEFRS